MLPQKIAILVLLAGGRDATPIPPIVDAVARTLAMRPSLALSVEEETFSDGVLLSCGTDIRCVAKALGEKVDVVLLIVAANNANPPILAFKLVDVKNVGIIAEARDKYAPRELLTEVGARADVLLEGAGYKKMAKLRANIDPAGAAIEIAGVAKGDATGALWVAPGKYEVVASHPGYDEKTAQVELIAGQETSIALQLDKDSSLVESPWLWAAIGVVAAGTATAFLVFRSGPSEACIPIGGATCE